MAQTKKPDEWIVIDDGIDPTIPTIPAEYIRRKPQPGDPKITLPLNILTALAFVKGDIVLFFEDDEYYAPGYINAMVMALEASMIAGISKAKYYHLPTRGWYRNANDRHASLAQTAIRAAALPVLMEVIGQNHDPFIDIKLWAKLKHLGKLFPDDENPLFVGMKGMPGRPGIGGGHKENLYRGRVDADYSILKKWMPKDHETYIKIREGLFQ